MAEPTTMAAPSTTSTAKRTWWPVAIVAILGGALHFAAIRAGVWWYEWDAGRVTAECAATDCQPQYYLATSMSYFGLALPLTYILGWTAMGVLAWTCTYRASPGLVIRLVVASILTCFALIGFSFWLTSRPEGHRWELWLGAHQFVPVLVASVVVALRAHPVSEVDATEGDS